MSRIPATLPQKGPRTTRAVDACSTHAHGTTDIRAVQAARTEESVTAENAYRDWSIVPVVDRPLAKHRAAHARVLFELLRDHQTSRSWLACVVGVNEKQVRKMLKGEVPIPAAIASCMPTDMRIDYLERLIELDGGTRPTLQDRIARLDKAGLLDALALITVALGSK